MRSAMHNSQCSVVHTGWRVYQSVFEWHLVRERRFWGTKERSDGVWYSKGGSGVQNHYRTTPSTPDRAFRYGSVEVAGELITSDACPEKLTIVRRAASDKRSCTKYEMRFGFVSYNITEGS